MDIKEGWITRKEGWISRKETDNYELGRMINPQEKILCIVRLKEKL